ncbi:hypothetical protein ACFPZN_24985, partial [Actinomadura rugatobispora]
AEGAAPYGQGQGQEQGAWGVAPGAVPPDQVGAYGQGVPPGPGPSGTAATPPQGTQDGSARPPIAPNGPGRPPVTTDGQGRPPVARNGFGRPPARPDDTWTRRPAVTPQTSRFTPGNTPGTLDGFRRGRLGPLSKGNVAAEVVFQGLDAAYTGMLSLNLTGLANQLTRDKAAADRYLADYAEYEKLGWVERRKRDVGQFLGLNDEEFIDGYFTPELRSYLISLWEAQHPPSLTPMNPNDRYGVLTPQDMARIRDTRALYRYRAGQEGKNLDWMMPERTIKPAPRVVPKDDRERDKTPPRSRIKSGKVTKGKIGNLHDNDDEPKTYGRQGASANTADPDYGNSGRESQAKKQQRNRDNGTYDSHNDSGPSGDSSSGGAPSGGAPSAPAPNGGGAPSGNGAPGSGGPPSGAGPAPDPGHGKLNKLDGDPPAGGGGGDPSKRV